MTDNHVENFEALSAKLNALEICLAENESGMLTVYTESEPLFCYDVTSLENAEHLVSKTLEQYARLFYNIEGLRVKSTHGDVTPPSVPVERVRPVAKITPVFDIAA